MVCFRYENTYFAENLNRMIKRQDQLIPFYFFCFVDLNAIFVRLKQRKFIRIS